MATRTAGPTAVSSATGGQVAPSPTSQSGTAASPPAAGGHTAAGKSGLKALRCELATLDNDRTRTVHFGSAGASDYTQHRDPVRKRQYLARHAPREHWENPMTAGALARWILWNKETLPSSIEDYTRRFGLAAV